MSEPAPERLAVTFNLTEDDYARYVASVERRGRSWSAFSVSVALFFSAIPVALLFRSLAAQRLDDPEAIEMAGLYSLYAFVLGILGSWFAVFVMGRIGRKRYLEQTADWHEPRTVELDHTGVKTTAKASQAQWQWKAVRRCTQERDLLLIWVTPFSAVTIPCRAFESEAALTQAFAFIRARLSEAKAAASPPPLPTDSST